jgi:hypothetical protein
VSTSHIEPSAFLLARRAESARIRKTRVNDRVEGERRLGMMAAHAQSHASFGRGLSTCAGIAGLTATSQGDRA